jgi:hypothetical protein
VRLNHPDQTVTISAGEKLVMKLDGNPLSIALADDQRTQVLVEEFGISEELAASLPADQPQTA